MLTGKTVVAAFDYRNYRKKHPGETCRLLFVAHREDILNRVRQGVGDFATGNKTFDNHYMKYAIRASYHFIVDFFNSL